MTAPAPARAASTTPPLGAATALFIEPLDVWLFRDGRPFTARADHHARSVFPPSPLTLYGALRTKALFDAVARERGSVLDRALVERTVGSPDDFTRFGLRGPLLGRRRSDGQVERWLPAPLDLVRPSGEDQAAWRLMAPEERVPGLATDGALAPPWARGSRADPAEGCWLPEDAFFATLLGQPPRPEGVLEAGALYAVEHRTGIELGWADERRPLRTAREGHLYDVAFIRPAPGVGLWLELHQYPLAARIGLVGLGGESRGSRYEVMPVVEPTGREDRRRAVARAGRLKVVLATPALFSAGWHPAWVDPVAGTTHTPLPGLRLVAAAVGRSQPIGGFDVVNRRPRPLHQAAPAGSLYWFRETEAGGAARAFDVLDAQSISDLYPEVGFGLSYIGTW